MRDKDVIGGRCAPRSHEFAFVEICSKPPKAKIDGA